PRRAQQRELHPRPDPSGPPPSAEAPGAVRTSHEPRLALHRAARVNGRLARRATTLVLHERARHIAHTPPPLPCAPAEVDLLRVHVEAFVEATDVIEAALSHCQARPEDPVDVPIAFVVTSR